MIVRLRRGGGFVVVDDGGGLVEGLGVPVWVLVLVGWRSVNHATVLLPGGPAAGVELLEVGRGGSWLLEGR